MEGDLSFKFISSLGERSTLPIWDTDIILPCFNLFSSSLIPSNAEFFIKSPSLAVFVLDTTLVGLIFTAGVGMLVIYWHFTNPLKRLPKVSVCAAVIYQRNLGLTIFESIVLRHSDAHLFLRTVGNRPLPLCVVDSQ